MMGRRLAHSGVHRRNSLWRSAAAALTFSFTAPGTVYAARGSAAFVGNIMATSRSTFATINAAGASAVDATSENNSNNIRMVLPHQDGSHNSVKIHVPVSAEEDGDDDPFNKLHFRDRLERTISLCRERNKASVWVSVPMAKASLIEDMTDTGLQFHHASGDTANLMVWLMEDTECKIPEFATHQVGVGALVVNSRDEILCVRELRKNFMPWKVPGGLSELGEHIDEAIVREVMEETGVPCKFLSVVSFRHSHNIQFGRSDLYFMCRLEPIEEEDESGEAIIPTPVPQAGEIEKAEWIPMVEYKDMISGEDGHPMMSHIVDIFEQGADIERTVLKSIVPGRKPSPIYHYPLNKEL
jgi:ADP-ribose pyrophosphatase YjhB (NUDIX family)